MKPSSKMIPLMVAGGIFTIIVGFVLVVLFISWFSNPPFGLGNAEAQPIAFPHTVHVQEHNIQCEFCHRNVTKGDAATVPAVEQCLFCHKDISGREVEAQTEIAKVQQHFEDGEPIDWSGYTACRTMSASSMRRTSGSLPATRIRKEPAAPASASTASR